MIPRCHSRPIAIAASVAFILGVAFAAARTIVQYQRPGAFDASAQGMCDFHNGIYFPTRAILEGLSPYGNDYAESNPVSRQIPFFSPGILVLHTPLAVLPLRIAEIAFFVISVLLVVCCAVLCASGAGVEGRFEWIIGIAAAIVWSRGGHITLFNGYFTIELLLATLIAIRYAKDRPLVAAIALAVVSAKPTYILPIGFLLLARGNYKTLVYGAIFSLLVTVIPLGWLAYHEGVRSNGAVDWSAGITGVIDDIQGAQEIHMSMEDESPVHSWTRLDLLAIICKWTGDEPSQATHLAAMLPILLWPMLILFRRAKSDEDDGVAGATGCLVILAVLSSLYHQSYDAILVAAPLAGLVAARLTFWRAISRPTRFLIGGLLAFPAFNFLSTRSALMRLNLDEFGYRAVTSLNGLALAASLVLLCILMQRMILASPHNPDIRRDT